MSTPKDGGPAFPTGPLNRADTEPGMSLRDWFAGQAINGLVMGPYYPDMRNDAEKIAVVAYWLADAMLAERAKERK